MLTESIKTETVRLRYLGDIVFSCPTGDEPEARRPIDGLRDGAKFGDFKGGVAAGNDGFRIVGGALV